MPRNDELTRNIPIVQVVFRIFQLFFIFLPSVLVWPLVCHNPDLRLRWYRSVKRLMELTGPAFIKLGQWSVTRRDMFPPEACEIFSELHCQVTPHSFQHTRNTIKAELGKDIEDIFSEFSTEPVGSGSIAQVYHARLANSGQEVAVKVCHPKEKEHIKVDFYCIRLFAKCIHPFYRWLNIPALADQFAENLSLQVDLRFEKYNGNVFHDNFVKSKTVDNPKPVDELVTERVKVESWVEGIPISNFFTKNPEEKRTAVQEKLANVGIQSFMQMLVVDNWLHSDLHPGNILVGFKKERPGQPVVSLVDTGIVQTLNEKEWEVTNSMIYGVVTKDGAKTARALLNMGPQTICDKDAFTKDIENLFKRIYPYKPKRFKFFLRYMGLLEEWEKMERICGIQTPVKTGKVNVLVQGVFDLVRKHKVIMLPTYVQLMVTSLMMEEICNRIDPDCDVMYKCEPWIRDGFLGYKRMAE